MSTTTTDLDEQAFAHVLTRPRPGQLPMGNSRPASERVARELEPPITRDPRILAVQVAVTEAQLAIEAQLNELIDAAGMVAT